MYTNMYILFLILLSSLNIISRLQCSSEWPIHKWYKAASTISRICHKFHLLIWYKRDISENIKFRSIRRCWSLWDWLFIKNVKADRWMFISSRENLNRFNEEYTLVISLLRQHRELNLATPNLSLCRSSRALWKNWRNNECDLSARCFWRIPSYFPKCYHDQRNLQRM